MTTYLTKIDDGKTHHFRVTVEKYGVSIVEGVFYIWLTKYYEGCGDHDSAIARQKQLIDEKLFEGFQITEFKEILENTVDVYDKAKWHYGGDFPNDLDDFQGYIHTGMFLGWLIDNNLVSEGFKNEHFTEIEQFKLHNLTGPRVFEYCCDGVLLIGDLNEVGNRFALSYFDFNTGQYLSDYKKTVGEKMPTLYHVADTWDNYSELKRVLDKRFTDWQRLKTKKPIWKFW